MSNHRLLILAVALQLVLFIFGWNWFGITPLLIWLLVNANQLSERQLMFGVLAIGLLSEWFTLGLRGEALASYVLLSVVLMWLKNRHPHYLNESLPLLGLVFWFALIRYGAQLLFIPSNDSGVLFWHMTASITYFVVLNSAIVIALTKYKLTRSYDSAI